jgi:hypothetical protein
MLDSVSVVKFYHKNSTTLFFFFFFFLAFLYSQMMPPPLSRSTKNPLVRRRVGMPRPGSAGDGGKTYRYMIEQALLDLGGVCLSLTLFVVPT